MRLSVFASQARILGVLLCLIGFCAGSAAAENEASSDDQAESAAKNSENGKGKSEKKVSVKNPFPNRFPAKDLEGGIEWLNTSGEISLKDLRGKVVLLDFWTFCCINCMHVLPDLAYLEKKFDKELVVIGVHSAKFDNERETGNIRKAILRYEIAHPVVNDAQMTIWRNFGVNSWPTLVLIDPEGYYCGYISGEGNREPLEQIIGRVIEYHKAKGTLDESPVHFNLERHKMADTPLKFPGKVLADTEGNRLFISDSNHNRIVIASLDGKLVDVVGTGRMGAEDGDYQHAEFDHPQGMCLVDETLYVADTENHLLRTIDLRSKTVSTLAGTGEQAHFRAKGGKLLASSLNSPWDLCTVHGVLYIAMAGPHQIWSHKLRSTSIHAYAGSGREDIRNGSLEDSALAQPSGIVTDGTTLFVVDSEGSSVRAIATNRGASADEPGDQVQTLVGTSDLPNGRSLFEFGDRDGVGSDARLQHPLGIVYHNNKLMVADSYNHKLKLIDPTTGSCATWLGTGKPGNGLEPVELAEPAGLSVAGDTLFVADTNNHRILAVNVNTKKTSEFVIDGLMPPEPSLTDESELAALGKDQVTEVAPQMLLSGDQIVVEVSFNLPEGYKLNELAPLKFSVDVVGDQQSLIPANVLRKRLAATLQQDKAVVILPVAEKSGEAVLNLALSYGYCRSGTGGLCKLATNHWKIPVKLSADSKAESISLTASPESAQ